MNHSEKLLSAFAEKTFFKDFVLDDLCFVPEGGSEIELADLIINLDQYIIAIQLKSRNVADQTDDKSREKKWLDKLILQSVAERFCTYGEMQIFGFRCSEYSVHPLLDARKLIFQCEVKHGAFPCLTFPNLCACGNVKRKL